MAEDIKRVGLEFTAEGVSDFQSQLKAVTAASQENYKAFKKQKEGYDQNTSAAKKLGDKQKYLQGQTEVYKTKVEVLSKQLEEMEADENADQQAIEKKKAALEKAKGSLAKYEAQLADVNAELKEHNVTLEAWQEKLGRVSDISGKAGTALSAGITAPVAAIAAASTAAWKEVDEAMDTVITKTGASGEALEGMQQVVSNIATTMPTDFQTAADAVGEVNTRFGSTGEELEKLSTQFIQFAAINDTDVSGAVDSASAVLKAFGQDASSAGSLLDALTTTSQATGLSVDTLASSLQKNALAFQEMGLTSEQAAGFMGQVEMSGMDTSKAMSGLKKAMQTATKQGIGLDEALAKFSETMEGNGSDTEKLKAAYDLFGKGAGDAFYNAAKNGTLSLTDLAGSMSDFAGSTESTFNATLDPLDQMTVAMNNMKLLGADIVNAAAPMISVAMQKIVDVATKLRTAWESLSPAQQQLIQKIALVAAAIGPLLIGFSKVTGTIKNVMGAFSGAGTVISALTSGPLGWIVLAIAAVVAAGVALWKNWDAVKEKAAALGSFLKGVWDGISSAAMSVFGPIAAKIMGFLSPIINFAKDIFAAVQGVFSGEISLKEVATGVWNTVREKAEEIWGTVTGLFTGEITLADVATDVWETMKGTADEIWKTVTGWFGAEIELPAIVTDIWKDLETAAGDIWTNVTGFFEGDISLKEVATGVWDTLKETAESLWGDITGFFGADINLAEVATDVWDTLKETASGIWDDITGFFGGSISLADVSTKAWDALSSTAESIWNDVTGFFGADISLADVSTKVWNTISSTAESIWSDVTGFFTSKITLPTIDVSEVWNNVTEKAGEIWDGVVDVFSSIEITWPDFGEMAASAFEGIKQAASDVWGFIKGIFSGEEEEELKTGEVDTSTVDDAVSTVTGGTDEMETAFKNLKLKVTDIDTSAYTTLARTTNATIQAINTVFNGLKLNIPTIGTSALSYAKAAVSIAAAAMRASMNFSWSLPTLHGHLPVISARMNSASSSDGKSKVDYPSIYLSGYTYFAQGGILTQPTLFGAIGGDSGPEAVLPLDKLWDEMDKRYQGQGMVNNFYINGDDSSEIAEEIARTLQRQLRMA